MKLSSKTITAIKMFIDLGEHYEDGFISLVDLAKRKDLSKKFLEQIVPLYKNNDLILGTRGNQGGYKLAKSPREISLKDIIYISENGFLKDNVNFGPIDNIVNGLDNLVDDYLGNIPLSKLVEDTKESYSNNYCI